MEERTYLSGTSLAGMSPTRSRVENDYYATPFEATEAISVILRIPSKAKCLSGYSS